MPRKTPTTTHIDCVSLPINALLELQSFHDELIGIAHTIDPPAEAGIPVRKHEQARRRALAKVFRLWAAQIDRNIKMVHGH